MANNKGDKVFKSYQFLLEKEKLNEGFTLTKLGTATGWSKNTITTYLPKKWKDLVHKKGDQY